MNSVFINGNMYKNRLGDGGRGFLGFWGDTPGVSFEGGREARISVRRTKGEKSQIEPCGNMKT